MRAKAQKEDKVAPIQQGTGILTQQKINPYTIINDD